jgi:HK97 family phage major capsid protein
VTIVPELASFGAGAGKSPILLGDIQRAYTVRIAGVPQVTTLAERYAEYLQRAAFAVTRFDGNITDARAVRALVTT